MNAIPQYSQSTHPEVLAAIRRNEEGFLEFRKRAFAFAEAQGAPNGAYYGSSFGGGHRISAIGGEHKPTTGRWKNGYNRGWLPFKNNPLYAELEAIRFDEESIPGLPSTIESVRDSDWRRYISTPRPFILDDVAYLGFSFLPVYEEGSKRPDPADGGWEEIKASEYHAARETYNERIKASNDDD